ncbi:MAG: PEP-CTERM sorting domain-containing protein [Akkermansiaceae bacterium]
MKIKHTILAAALLGVNSTHGAVLLGGFDGENAYNAPKQDASVVGAVNVLLTGPGNSGVPLQTLSPLWGTQAFLPAAESTNDDTVGIFDAGSALLTIQIINTGTNDLNLEQLHWWKKRDTNDSPDQLTITYVSGDLSDADGVNESISLGTTATEGIDYNLSNIVSDLTLAAGESATFSWAADYSGIPPATTRRLRVDNFAISGEVVPEPSTTALLGLGGLALILRRRK